MKTTNTLIAALLAAFAATAETIVDVTGKGVQKIPVEINVDNQAFARSLGRNLELSGLFAVGRQGAIKVTGGSGALRAEGRGKALPSSAAFTDDKSARMAARRFSDAMCQAFGGQKGFASDKVLFLNRGRAQAKGSAIPAELCECYPDGGDVRQLTSDGKMVIFQRWSGVGDKLMYISDKGGTTQIWQMDAATGQRSVMWSFKGTPTGIAVSPDGSKVAAILSFQGNPELYSISIAKGTWTRLTNTPYDVEGQPTWSPDGTHVAFVRGVNSQQIWVVDVATGKERRLTSRGRKNVDPDWGPDGRIAYVAGSTISVMDPATGDGGARVVAEPANWEHPSWSRNGRHLTASRDKALFLIDTLDGGDKPRQMFRANGNWVSPCWSRRAAQAGGAR